MFLDEDNWDVVRSVSTPTYNTFTFFDVSEEVRLLPHTVTEVRGAVIARAHRYGDTSCSCPGSSPLLQPCSSVCLELVYIAVYDGDQSHVASVTPEIG